MATDLNAQACCKVKKDCQPKQCCPAKPDCCKDTKKLVSTVKGDSKVETKNDKVVNSNRPIINEKKTIVIARKED